MGSDLVLKLLSDVLWTGLLIIAPLLAVTLIVGLLVSIFQVVTQVQEASLTFIPKLIAAIVVLIALGPWMLTRLVGFASHLIADIPSYL